MHVQLWSLYYLDNEPTIPSRSFTFLFPLSMLCKEGNLFQTFHLIPRIICTEGKDGTRTPISNDLVSSTIRSEIFLLVNLHCTLSKNSLKNLHISIGTNDAVSWVNNSRNTCTQLAHDYTPDSVRAGTGQSFSRDYNRHSAAGQDSWQRLWLINNWSRSLLPNRYIALCTFEILFRHTNYSL